MPFNLLSMLIIAIEVALPIALLSVLAFVLMTNHMKTHPISGTVVGKAQREGRFLLYLRDSEGVYTWTSTNETRWNTTSINDHYQMDIPGGDWYVLSRW